MALLICRGDALLKDRLEKMHSYHNRETLCADGDIRCSNIIIGLL